MRAGLPQGSLLGPLLFKIFINELNYAVPDVSLRLYADDTTLYASDVSPIALQFVVNRVLEIIASLWRENSSRHLKTELCTRVLELCSRSES